MNEDFNDWTRPMLIRQWWYVYLWNLKQNERDPGWLNEMTDVCQSRGIIKEGLPMPKDGAEDLAKEVDEWKANQQRKETNV